MSEIRERAKEIDRLMEAYWNAAYREGVEFRIHDDEAGTAQKASAELRGFITDLLAELEQIRQKAAMECVAVVEDSVHDGMDCMNAVAAIKSHFNLEAIP